MTIRDKCSESPAGRINLPAARSLIPGLIFCIVIAGIAILIEDMESALLGRAWLQSIVVAILAGATVRSCWPLGETYRAGINFAATRLLELAVMLLGASLTVHAIAAIGPGMITGVAAVVILSLVCGFVIGRCAGLPPRLSALIAIGNSICGNSAIAAAAPVLRARPEDVIASISFTAALGVLVVLILPVCAYALGLDDIEYGAVAGLTVYAVPQVIAATTPVSALSGQIGTLVKLLRVMMLGPLLVALTLLLRARMLRRTPDPAQRDVPLPLSKCVPWFIIGFGTLASMRAANWIPAPMLRQISVCAEGLTLLSMAALGLSVDFRTLFAAAPRIILAVVGSVFVLLMISIGLVHTLTALAWL